MKFKFLNTGLLLVGLTISTIANSALITHNGYTLDTDTRIVTKGNVEWLQWTETIDKSINNLTDGTLDGLTSKGWTLATNVQFAGLFNDFGLASTADENESSVTFFAYDSTSDTTAVDTIMKLFGTTAIISGVDGYGTNEDAFHAGVAIFGTDNDADGMYNHARVRSDYLNDTNPGRSMAVMYNDLIFKSARTPLVGLALRRDSVLQVSEPASFAIFALGMIGLASRRFKK